MKQRYLLLLPALMLGAGLSAQTIWTETFSNNCSAGCQADQYVGTNGAWTQTITGTEGADPNVWFVSCAENGNGAGNCGSVCASTQNPTLHISAAVGNPFCANDCGATYDAGGFCGTFTCPATSRRIESPLINCSSATTPLAVDFLYIATGSAPADQCSFWYHDGTSWTQIQALPATNNSGCSGQGRWTNISIMLPTSAIGNANVKIAFEWVNNDDGVGTDPSIAIDDINVSITTSVNTIAVADAKVGYDAQSDLITINTGVENSMVLAELYTVDGRLILSQQSSTSISTMDVSALAAGTYVLRLTGDQRTFTPVKLVIE